MAFPGSRTRPFRSSSAKLDYFRVFVRGLRQRANDLAVQRDIVGSSSRPAHRSPRGGQAAADPQRAGRARARLARHRRSPVARARAVKPGSYGPGDRPGRVRGRSWRLLEASHARAQGLLRHGGSRSPAGRRSAATALDAQRVRLDHVDAGDRQARAARPAPARPAAITELDVLAAAIARHRARCARARPRSGRRRRCARRELAPALAAGRPGPALPPRRSPSSTAGAAAAGAAIGRRGDPEFEVVARWPHERDLDAGDATARREQLAPAGPAAAITELEVSPPRSPAARSAR